MHYFDDLNALGADHRLPWHLELIDRWIDDNPLGQGTGWEPYPCSLRIVNWIKWALRGNRMPERALASLAVQVRWLRQRIEYHILGNHLLANAKALVFAGFFFDGPEADSWLNLGLKLFDSQLAEQVLPDGGHFELSPMYHSIVLEDLLDVINLLNAYGRQIPTHWRSTASRMLSWLSIVVHPDGDIPFFNDAVLGVAPSLRTLREYASRLGISYEVPSSSVYCLHHSGYVRVDKGDATVILDVAPVGPDYLPGHAHADTLSFELSLHGRRVFVNSGISQYGNDNIRLWQRGTAAHNTVTIDNVDSSEVWGGFRVARRARIVKREIHNCESEIRICAAHDGYRRLRGKPIHQRTWVIADGSLTLRDEIVGKGKHSAVSRLYVHPDFVVEMRKQTAVIICRRSGELVCQVKFRGSGQTKLQEGAFHPEFGITWPCFCIVHELQGDLPLFLEATISWRDLK